MLRVILFDLDDTLYPREAGIMDQIRFLMLRYISAHFGLNMAQADVLRKHYFQTYGTTMRGLQKHHQIDPDEFLHYVHDIPVHEYLQPNPQLDAVLATIPYPKIIFTNASREHAEGVLEALGIRHHFERIVDVRDMSFESKPQPGAYLHICELLAVEPQECLLIEDNVQNLRPAKAVGMTTVLVKSDWFLADDSVDYVIARIEEIDQVFKQLPGEG
jgi:putative hydrolase of the HAD superfamily